MSSSLARRICKATATRASRYQHEAVGIQNNSFTLLAVQVSMVNQKPDAVSTFVYGSQYDSKTRSLDEAPTETPRNHTPFHYIKFL